MSPSSGSWSLQLVSKGTSVSGEGCSQGGHLFAVASRGGRCRQLSGVSSMRALIPIHDLITIRAPQLPAITWARIFYDVCYVRECFACTYICACLVLVEARGGHLMPWN